MLVFGVHIDSQPDFDRHCLPAIAAFGGADATLVTSTDRPVARTYNEILSASLDMNDVEALVFLRQDVEITDPRFRARIEAAFEADPLLAVIGPAAPGGENEAVDAVDDSCMILRPHLAGRLRFDESAFTGDSGYDIDFCRRVRMTGYRVARVPLGVERHAGDGDDDGRVSAAAVWQARRAQEIGRETIERLLSGRKEPPVGEVGGGALADGGGYVFDHPEILAHLPAGLTRVLDVGCGAGALGATVKERTGATVVGIELSPALAALARDRIDDVLEIDLDTATTLPYDPQTFDAIVLAGSLERLADPERTLRTLVRHLAPSGRLVVTVPNVKHWSVVLPLLVQDRWEYDDTGLLARSTRRHFTMAEAATLLSEVGLPVVDACAARTVPLADPAELDPLLRCLGEYGVDVDQARTLLETHEFLIVAGRA